MPPNMPPGWEAMRNAFPPELRDPFEAAYPITFPGDPSKWKDDITWNLFQVLRLQTAMQAYVNKATEQQVAELRALRKEIREAIIAFTQAAAANNEASLRLHQAAQVIRDAEVTRKDYEVLSQKNAIPVGAVLFAALLWSLGTLGGQYYVSTAATASAIQASIHRGAPPPGSLPLPTSSPLPD